MKTSLLGLLILALISCAKKDEAGNPATAAAQTAQHSELMKNWKSDQCIASKLLPVSQTHYKIEYDLSGDTFAKRYNYYTDAACNTQIAQVTYTGTFSLADSHNEDTLQSKHFDTTFRRALVKASNEEGQKFLQAVDLCGVKDFPLGKDIEMTANSTQTLCVLQTSTNVTYFDRAIVKDGNLLLATGYSEKPTNKDGNARPNIDVSANERFIPR